MITAIVQARMGSSRLPGKVMLSLQGQPMIYHVLQRIQTAQRLQQIVVATTTDPSDDPLAAYLSELGVATFRGSPNDVLDRYYQAALQYQASVIVRLTADCPLLDARVIDQTIGLFISGDYDYVSNFLVRTYPDGLDAEVFSMASLTRAWQEAQLPSEREHVTPYLYKHPQRFRQVGLVQAIDRSQYRWTVDEPADFKFVQAIYSALYPDDPHFDTAAIEGLLERQPALVAINQGIPTNAGYQKSLAEDQAQQPQFYDEVRTFVHDTAMPLTAVRGYADLLLKHQQGKLTLSEEEQAKFLTLIKNNATTLAAYILNMGEIVRFERDPHLDWEAIPPQVILEKMVEIIARSTASKRGLQVSSHIAPDAESRLLWADLERLHRLMQRLVENAIAYTPDDGHITLSAALSPDQAHLILSVQDNGIGILPEDHPHIFERYWRSDRFEVRQTPGSGMGLSIAKLYAQALGGRIWFQSTPGQGSTFFVELRTAPPL
jgi:spore coat polysaccharide biosynthesis protein SpsF